MCSYGGERVFFIGGRRVFHVYAGYGATRIQSSGVYRRNSRTAISRCDYSYYGTYTSSPPKVLPFSSRSRFNRIATFRTLSRHSSSSRQLLAAIQHSEHAFDAEFTVSSSNSPRACRAVRISTIRLSPALHVFIPPVGFVVVSDTRYEDASPRQ